MQVSSQVSVIDMGSAAQGFVLAGSVWFGSAAIFGYCALCVNHVPKWWMLFSLNHLLLCK